MASEKADDASAVADRCPRHGGEVVREYDFGRDDATIYVYGGCQCAAVASDVSAWLCDSYTEAVGHARLVVAQASS